MKYSFLLVLYLTIAINIFGQVSIKAQVKDDVGLQEIHHVGINITNLQHSADWYNKVFEFAVLQKYKTAWLIGNDKIKVMLYEHPNGAKIANSDSTILITHIAFSVDSSHFEKIQLRFKSMGVPFDPPIDVKIAFSIFIRDPDGHRIEIARPQ